MEDHFLNSAKAGRICISENFCFYILWLYKYKGIRLTVDHHVEVIDIVLNGHALASVDLEAQHFDGVILLRVAADVANVAAFRLQQDSLLKMGNQ